MLEDGYSINYIHTRYGKTKESTETGNGTCTPSQGESGTKDGECVAKKSESLSRGERSPSARDWAGAIRELRQEGHNLHFMLERIKMARSTYYYNVAHLAPTDKYQAVRSRISEIFAQHHNRYGYRRACIQLRNEGYVINHKTV